MADDAPILTDAVAPAGPALSATSDMPEFKQAKAPADAAVDVKPVVVDSPATEAEVSGDGEAKPAKADTTPPAIKREITIERNKRRAAEDQAKLAQDRLDKALDAIEKLTPKPQVQARPNRDSYDNPDAYDEALIKWSAEQASKTTEAELTQKARTEAQERDNRALQAAWTERKAAFAADHADYAEVAEADDVQITLPMAAAILNDDDGPAVAYFLGQNKDEAARIALLAPARQAVEIGRIAARLSAAPPAKPVKADPINPLGARNNAGPKSPDEESADEYYERRTKEIQAQRRPFVSG